MSVWPTAREYITRGWAVIPLHSALHGTCTCGKATCSKPGKHPRTAHGLADASRDPMQGAAWAQLYPSANLGLPQVVNGLFAVDLDGDEAVATWRHLLDQHRPVPTLTSRTARGYHLVYRQPEGEPLGDSVGKLAPGIDTRGKGYIVAPPSIHVSGHVYAWCAGPTDPAPCPPWLEDLARAAAQVPQPAATAPRRAVVGAPGRVLAALVQVVLDATQGQRNMRLYWAACRGADHVNAGRMAWDEDIVPALTAAAEAVGLEAAETHLTLRSASRRLGGGPA